MSLLYTARFQTTATRWPQMPRLGIPELAFAGRSNAGKSTAINVICRRRRLAFASRTPGRTQALNYFALGADDRIDAFLVDMPGYGYAQAPHDAQREWQALAGRYLAERTSLVGVVMIVDARRGLGDLDRALLDWIGEDKELLVLLSKADKLTTAEKRQVRERSAFELREGWPALAGRVSIELFSATQDLGVDTARSTLDRWLAPMNSAALATADEVTVPAGTRTTRRAMRKTAVTKKNPG